MLMVGSNGRFRDLILHWVHAVNRNFPGSFYSRAQEDLKDARKS